MELFAVKKINRVIRANNIQITHIWPTRWSTTKFIFLANRYLNIVIQPIVVVHMAGLKASHSHKVSESNEITDIGAKHVLDLSDLCDHLCLFRLFFSCIDSWLVFFSLHQTKPCLPCYETHSTCGCSGVGHLGPPPVGHCDSRIPLCYLYFNLFAHDHRCIHWRWWYVLV